MQGTPFLRLLVPLCIGVGIEQYVHSTQQLWLTTLIPVCLILLFFLRNASFLYQHFWGLSLFVFIVSFGYLRSSLQKVDFSQLSDQQYFVEADEFPQGKAKSYLLVCQFIHTDKKILLYLPKTAGTAAVRPGDVIGFVGKPLLIENEGNPYEFDYQRYLNAKNIGYRIFLKENQIFVLQRAGHLNFYRRAQLVRAKLIEILFQSGLHAKNVPLVASIAFGARSEVDKETIQKFTNTGVIHVLAVSGMNVGLVFVILDLLLRSLKSRRWGLILYTLLLLLGIWFYALITGMSASIMRATLMFSFVLVGKALQRNSNIFNSMAVSAFLLIAWTPSILGDIGFQLSYAAVLSIVIIQPLLYKHCYFKNWIADKIWLLMSVTFAAQFGTLPFTLLYFHQFPVYFWLANLVVIPLVTMILYLSFVVLFLYFISSFFSGLVAFLLDCSIRLVVYTVDFVDALPHAIIKNLYPSIWQIIVFLLVILMFYYFLKSRRLLLLKGTLLAMIVLVTISIVKNYHKLSKVEIVFFNIGGPRMLLLNSGGSILILYDQEVKEPERLDYYLKNYLGRCGIHEPAMFPLGDSLRLQGQNCYMMGSLLFFEGIRLYLQPPGWRTSAKRELAIPADLIWMKNFKGGKQLVLDGDSSKLVFCCKALEKEENIESKREQMVLYVDKAVRISVRSKDQGTKTELSCTFFDKAYSRSNPLPCLTISASPVVQSTMVEGLLSP